MLGSTGTASSRARVQTHKATRPRSRVWSVYASREEYEAALDLADGRLRATDACIAALAKAYAKGLPTK